MRRHRLSLRVYLVSGLVAASLALAVPAHAALPQCVGAGGYTIICI